MSFFTSDKVAAKIYVQFYQVKHGLLYGKINSWVSFSFLYDYGAPLGGPWGRRSSAINVNKI